MKLHVRIHPENGAKTWYMSKSVIDGGWIRTLNNKESKTFPYTNIVSYCSLVFFKADNEDIDCNLDQVTRKCNQEKFFQRTIFKVLGKDIVNGTRIVFSTHPFNF